QVHEAGAGAEHGDRLGALHGMGQGSGDAVDRGLDVDGITAALSHAVERAEPVAMLGASASFVHLLDALAAGGTTYELPAGSRILDTGGYKGQSRELAPDAFYDALARTFGVPRERCTNMYGMTELSSQFYDAGNAVVPSVKRAPHWVRTRVVDPLTGRDVPAGERGVLVHCDLANFNSATTILTEDDGGFLLLGRAQGAEAKGCSLAVQEFLEAARA
ncbi:MAG: long-chain fatty acid--CoA ligase, partial [Comamonadaceae bacterium]